MAKKAQKKVEQKDDEVMTEKNGIELGHKDGVTISYVRIIESTRFPLTAQEHADRAKSVQVKMNIDPANIKSINIQGVDHQVIENTKRYMAFNNKYEVAKVDYYRPKAENTKSKQTELAQ